MRDIQLNKHCFIYCGDTQCNCGAKMENLLGDIYGQVESDPRPVDNKTTNDAKQRSMYPYGEGILPDWKPSSSVEYYPPGITTKHE